MNMIVLQPQGHQQPIQLEMCDMGRPGTLRTANSPPSRGNIIPPIQRSESSGQVEEDPDEEEEEEVHDAGTQTWISGKESDCTQSVA